MEGRAGEQTSRISFKWECAGFHRQRIFFSVFRSTCSVFESYLTEHTLTRIPKNAGYVWTAAVYLCFRKVPNGREIKSSDIMQLDISEETDHAALGESVWQRQRGNRDLRRLF